MQYELDKQYEMNVVDIRKDSAGYDYIALQDEDPTKEYRVYNILKCQYDSLPKTLYVKVKSIDAFGRIKLKQDEERLVKEHYQPGKLYPFEVTDVKEDINTKAQYYVIEDEFKAHHYYYQGKQKYYTGDDCILEVEGFTDKGFLKLKEVEHVANLKVEHATTEDANCMDQRLDSLLKSLPVLEGVQECETVELKSSIVYPPDGNGEADIDKQLYNILKELTAFMNTEGGTLYIGIHDKTKKVIGIEDDLKHLNDGQDDYAGSYNVSTDHYELKIRNTLDRLCPSVANSLINVEFPALEGHTYCRVTVKKAKRPIFLSGSQLWIRQGNRLKRLRGDEITFFITNRMTISIMDFLDTDDITVNTGTMDIGVMTQIMRDIINERHAIPAELPKLKSLDEVDYWIIWYGDATWKRSRSESTESNVYMQVPVYKAMSDPILTFCYESGRINTMKIKDFRTGANLNKIQKDGWSKKEKPMNIFIMHKTDYLVGYSVDHNGDVRVKLHAISDYETTRSAKNQGAPFLPSGWQIKSFSTIGAEHRKKVEHLVVTKANRTREAGTPLTSDNAQMKEEIGYLEKVLKQE